MSHQKSRILAQLRFPLRLSHARPAHAWAIAAVSAIALGTVVTAFGTAPDTLLQSIQQENVVEPLRATPESLSWEGSTFVREERVRSGDSAASLLKRLGVGDASTVELLRQTPDAAQFFRQISPGKLVSARLSTDGALQSLVFPLNGSADRAIVIERAGAGFAAKELALPVETQVIMKSAEISFSLFGATDAAGIPDSVATQLADIFGGDIDFHRDLRKGDRFSVIYEAASSQGKTVRAGRILAAEFVNDSKVYRAVWYGDKEGRGGYYTPEGKNLRKAFLRSPLEFSRVTSGFSSARFHPILQTWRAHKGVDYGAPIGTRVRATGDGTVEFVGVQGGYGKVVVLRHQGRYSTVYGHLSTFAPGIRKGAHVNQGDIVAYTGQSGLASGPHLHYEFRIDGVHQNPLTVALPGSPPLSQQQLSGFHQSAAAQMERMAMLRSGNLSALD